MFDELMAEDTENGANGWVFKLDKEMKRGLKMKIWSKRLENGHDISKAVYNMPNVKMSQVESFINAFDTKNTDPYVESMTVLARDEVHKYGKLTRVISKIPMMTKRECVFAMNRTETANGEICYLMNTVDHPDYPKNN